MKDNFVIQIIYSTDIDVVFARTYTDHAGLEIPVDLCIASPFSRQIAICNAGPS